MKRSTANIASALAVMAMLGPGGLLAQLTLKPVTGQIYMLAGEGGNVAVSAGKDGIVIIDDKYKGRAEHIKTDLATL